MAATRPQLFQMPRFLQRLAALVEEHLGPVPEPDIERAMSMSDISAQARPLIEGSFNTWDVWVYGISREEDGSLFALAGSEGRIYRIPLVIEGTDVSIGAVEEVAVQYVPVARGITFTRDQATGRTRYTRVVSTAILLRGSLPEIDSTELMDSFIEYAERTGEYPIASIHHLGPRFRVGQADHLWRSGPALWESGLFDETPFAIRTLLGLLAAPEEWGTSIEYVPLREADVENIGGVDVQVWRAGIHVSSDFLPEALAAAHFTTALSGVVNREVAVTPQQRETLIRLGHTEEEIAAMDALDRTIETEAATRITRQAAGDTPEGEQPEDALVVELDEQVAGEIARVMLADPALLVTPLVAQVLPQIQATIRETVAAVVREAMGVAGGAAGSPSATTQQVPPPADTQERHSPARVIIAIPRGERGVADAAEGADEEGERPRSRNAKEPVYTAQEGSFLARAAARDRQAAANN